MEVVYYNGMHWEITNKDNSFVFMNRHMSVYEDRVSIGENKKHELKCEGQRFNPLWLKLAVATIRKRAEMDPNPMIKANNERMWKDILPF